MPQPALKNQPAVMLRRELLRMCYLILKQKGVFFLHALTPYSAPLVDLLVAAVLLFLLSLIYQPLPLK